MSGLSISTGWNYTLRPLRTVLAALAAWRARRRRRAALASLASLAPEIRSDIGVDVREVPGKESMLLQFHPAAVSVQCMAMASAHAPPREQSNASKSTETGHAAAE
ncbi:MAG: hypothetical protein ACKOED_05435 [Aestuariivirga sp.]|uniref:hypothetical protein n=1 Tax=Aestuariivirga sp. TaxID=2650926 RepID=UPI0038D25746